MMESYGVIVEGPYEEGVYEEFIRKICPEARNIRFRTAGGCSQVMKRFPTLLQSLEHVTDQGGPVEKALVTRDADCKDPAIIEAKMQESVSRCVFSFPKGVGYHAVRQETETWLLADPEAITRQFISKQTVLRGVSCGVRLEKGTNQHRVSLQELQVADHFVFHIIRSGN